MSFLTFREIGNPGRKTKIWQVNGAATGAYLGTIHWFSHWRCYVFHSAPDATFDSKCLTELAKELSDRTRDQRADAAALKEIGP
jgi:hypothetical protein